MPTPPKYHRQDVDDLCGLACAQIALGQFGVEVVRQEDLASTRSSYPPGAGFEGWSTSPDQLAGVLHSPSIAPDFVRNRFSMKFLTPHMRSLAWSMQSGGIAWIALVFEDMHWVVVSKIDTTREPSNATDRRYAIKGVEIKDPWVPARLASPLGMFVPAPMPPPPHAISGDDLCGTGGAEGGYGTAYQHISYHWWMKRYFTGLPEDYPGPKRLITISLKGTMPTRSETFIAPEPLPPIPFPGLDRLIRPEEAQNAATRGVAQYGLSSREPWHTKLMGTVAGESVLVTDADMPGPSSDYYYIVPLQRSETDIPVAVIVAAKDGVYRQAVALEGSGSLLVPPRTREETMVRSLRSSRKFDMHNAILQTPLVWRPCRESFSPFWPFALLTLGQQKFYVRNDGEVFTQLSEGKQRLRGI